MLCHELFRVYEFIYHTINKQAGAEVGQAQPELGLRVFVKPNNKRNPYNKLTLAVVGLRQSNRWGYHVPTTTITHTNSKLHDRVEIQQNSEIESC